MNEIMGFSSSLLLGIVVALAAVVIICRTILAGWRDWIALKHAEMAAAAASSAGQREASRDGGSHGDGDIFAASRIELADMRERLRKLEAIAAGVDL